MYFLALPQSNLKDGSTGLVKSARLDKWIWQGLAGGPGGVGAGCAGKWESWALLRAFVVACCPLCFWAREGSWTDAERSPDAALGESSLSPQHRFLLSQATQRRPGALGPRHGGDIAPGFRDHRRQRERLCKASRDTLIATELCTAGIARVRPEE